MSHSAPAHAGHHHEPHPPSFYVKIWAILLVLLVISVVGPMLGIRILTLVTAFGIAVVKAAIVCAFFMHLNVEKRFVWYLLATMLMLLGLFWIAVAADIWKPDGQNWTNAAAHQYIKEGEATPIEGQGGHGEHK
jgi:caa(3)-type oxidase subunit IV